MSKYTMEDGTVVNTAKSKDHWSEATRFDGRNHISVATGTQWNHQTLYESRKGRFYIVNWSDYQGSSPHAEWVSEREAVRWLLANGHDDDIPASISHLIEEVEE